jgi:ubiquinone/menaquinone biosynthesis C-methylase UbiE
MTSELNHQNKILERFTATADVFAESVRTMRVEESDHLVELATAGLALDSESLAIDVACGPGTFTRPFASRVHRAVGVDLTPAMIEKARAEAARAGITNIEFIRGDIYALPFADGIASIVACGYAFHHMQEPAQALAEMARVLRPGGRVAIVDFIVPEGPGGAIQNNIERLRDPSHTNAQTVPQFRSLIQDAGLRPLSEEVRPHWYDFDLWMRNAGSLPGDADYVHVRRMMEEIMVDDASGLKPRYSEKTGNLEFLHTVLLLVAEKPE